MTNEPVGGDAAPARRLKREMKSQTLAASLLLLFASAAFGQTQMGTSKLRSPNGRVEITFALDREGAPVYSVSYDGRPVVNPSRLGLVFKELGLLSNGMEVLRMRRHAGDSWYKLVVGKASRARDR